MKQTQRFSMLLTTVLIVLITAQTQAQEPKQPRIVGGEEAEVGAWPHQVAVIDPRRVTNGPNYYPAVDCGGSILNENWVVTAGHCVVDRSGNLVSAGTVNIVAGLNNVRTPEDGYQQRAVSQIILHEAYDNVYLDNDIALLELTNPITIGGNIQPIALVPADIGSLEGITATVTGWGDTTGSQSYPEALRQVQVPILDTAQCEVWYDLNQGADDWFTDNMLCAGYVQGGKDSCQGDSGGPLVIPNGDSWQLAGIVSWGLGCADPQQPGAYARVSQYIDWIAEKTGQSPTSTPTPTSTKPATITPTITATVPTTNTSTPIPTFTPTPTTSVTTIPTQTPTPTSTNTPTSTVIPNPTASVTAMPTTTQTPTITPTIASPLFPPDTPNDPVLITPQETVNVDEEIIAFRWKAAQSEIGIAYYSLYLSPDTSILTLTTTQTITTTKPAYSYTQTLPVGTYQWSVSAHDTAGNSTTVANPATFDVVASKRVYLPMIVQ